MPAKIYSNKKRPIVFTPFKVGRNVFYHGEKHIITAVDAWPEETYLAIQKDLKIPEFLIVEAGEIEVKADEY